MLKLSRLTDYAVVVLGELAAMPDRIAPASALASAAGLSEATVSKVLKIMAKAGIVSSVRGASGGYQLTGIPEKISLLKVIESLEGPIELVNCVEGGADMCALENVCHMRGRWNPINVALRKALSGVMLADMLPSSGARSVSDVRQAEKRI